MRMYIYVCNLSIFLWMNIWEYMVMYAYVYVCLYIYMMDEYESLKNFLIIL